MDWKIKSYQFIKLASSRKNLVAFFLREGPKEWLKDKRQKTRFLYRLGILFQM